MSRWIELIATTPSGKAQFVCRYCGRVDVTTSRECKPLTVFTGGPGQHPLNKTSCADLEEQELERVRTSIVWNAIGRADTLVQTLSQGTLDAVAALRRDRLFILEYMYLVFREVYEPAQSPHERDQMRRVDELYQMVVAEMKKK